MSFQRLICLEAKLKYDDCKMIVLLLAVYRVTVRNVKYSNNATSNCIAYDYIEFFLK